ncbi:Transmembrane protein [Paraburkholderia sacchari]|uniref:hypothetical protein n=1 Tax=Paraburkholderia sacchari TaxID=159450 RepID=UPI0039A4AA27
MAPLVATLALLIVVFVHASLPRFMPRGPKRLIAHASLLLVGLGFGVVSAMLTGPAAPPWAVIACGMGIVHVPALCLLVLKRMKR